MTQAPERNSEEQQAIGRFAMMSGVRIGSLAILLFGVAIAQRAVDAPYWLAVVLAIGGMLGFFFGPYFMAKNWKSQNDESSAGPNE